MRVVLTADGSLIEVEELDGYDAVGGERWIPVDFSSASPGAWAKHIAEAVARGPREPGGER
jgi:hypothetical protein